MATIRLPDTTEKKIEEIAKEYNETKSFVVKEALAMYLAHHEKSTNPYESGKELFGLYGNGNADLSRDRKAILKEKLRAKNAR